MLLSYQSSGAVFIFYHESAQETAQNQFLQTNPTYNSVKIIQNQQQVDSNKTKSYPHQTLLIKIFQIQISTNPLIILKPLKSQNRSIQTLNSLYDLLSLLILIYYQSSISITLLQLNNPQQMSDEIYLHNLWYRVSGAEFGFYTPDEARESSVKQITNPNAFDVNKNPQKDGLYDPAMGVSPNDRFSVCDTCGQEGLECSGHFGHLELLLPTYNPLVMDKLMQLLKLQCASCHRLRIRHQTVIEYEHIFKLLRKGALLECQQLEEVFRQQRKLQKVINKEDKQREKREARQAEKGQKKNQKISEKAEKAGQKTDKTISKLYRKCLQAAKTIREQLEQQAQDTPLQKNSTNYERELFNTILKQFYRQGFVKCPYCSQVYKGIKKQGCSKIFGMIGQQKDKRKRSSSTTKGESSNMQQETNNAQQKKQVRKQRYINPLQVYNGLKALWRKQYRLMDLIFGNGESSNTFEMFFLNVIIVPPNRFRPESKLGEQMFLHDHTVVLTNIIKANKTIKHLLITESLDNSLEEKNRKGAYEQKNKLSIIDIKNTDWFKEVFDKVKDKADFINKWLQLQDYVNIFIDATKASKASDRQLKGLRQILQKKEGLFRMKMMGKRVNYAARSVISPDPSLQTNEVGLPVFMAKKLSFPEPVNAYNCEKLKQLIINGKQYPGASFIEQNGTLIKLDVLNQQQRISLARNLLVNVQTKTVYRHLMTGDNVLFNRQPTLHKPGLMAHKIRVLPKQQTLRMNYSNCKSYNADFDGDEMNLHALQNYQAKAEAQLCITDRIYTNPTNGRPIRQLIQDSIIAAVYLTLRDTFLTKSQYSELLYQATSILFQDKPKNCRIFLLQPAIQKPKRLWTGKQLIGNIIKLIVHLAGPQYKNQQGLNMKSVSCIPPSAIYGNASDQSVVRIVDNELVQGMIDKNQIGSGFTFGLVHSFNQLYGYKMTGQLQTCLTKLFSNYLQLHGFSCGIDDLILTKKSEKNRMTGLQGALDHAVKNIAQFLNVKEVPQNLDYVQRGKYSNSEKQFSVKPEENILTTETQLVQKITERFLNDPNALGEIQTEYKIALRPKVQKVTNQSLKGFYKRFPDNRFSIMVLTGAKGSSLNHSQISVMLGQQELQGKRVPMMISGKTLPCFIPYDPNPRAYGFVSDRFLTGLRQQEFYFHCMAGREGLIDTAVKTSRSGYLQRCLMKHLESLKVEYDYTVRDADSGIIQFYFGEDAIDPAKQKFLTQVDFLHNNKDAFSQKYKLNHFKKFLNTKQIKEFKKSDESKNQTIMNYFPLGKNLVSLSQKAYQRVEKYKSKLNDKHDKKYFQELYQLKYLNAISQPGESVGCTAAQAVGEPSTQMTLNTFHLAGHGGVNLTLGIPRLREILMTSTDKLKTPIMQLSFKEKVTEEQAQRYAAQLQKIRLISLVNAVQVEQTKKMVDDKGSILIPDLRKRVYSVKIIYQDLSLIEKQFKIKLQSIHSKIVQAFLPMLLNYIQRVHKKAELRTQIKRNVKADKEEESGDENEEAEDEVANKKQKQDDNQEDKIKELKESAYFHRMQFGSNHCNIEVQVPLGMKKFLMTKVIQRFLKATVMREVKGINRAIVVLKEQNAPYTIQTEGVNFRAVQQLPFINHQNISSNDIQTIYKVFGIEAAREAVVRQIVGVFKAYKVAVDYRHLYLIADYMTFPGAIKAMNRNWMRENISPFLKMSFQTSCTFLTAAACFREVDRMRTPSSQIAIGQAPSVGTGVFDIFMDMKFQGMYVS